MNQQEYRNLISGRKKGFSASLLRLLLILPAMFYAVAIRIRNRCYDLGLRRIRSASVPVICIGNITAGGTGKTPLVIWLSNLLLSKDIPTAVLTRGYKTNSAKSALLIDEPAILAQSCPGLQVVVNPDRVAGAVEATRILGAKALVMDDGFQHRRLARNLDIVTIDATDPFGSGKILPAGMLREPLSSLRRAHAAVITRADQASERQLADIEQSLLAINPDLAIARATHAPVSAVSDTAEEITLDSLKGKKVFAFCGIGNPTAFFETIRGLGCELTDSRTFDDHHHYSLEDIAQIHSNAQSLGAEIILTTQKDWVSSPFSLPTGDPKPDFQIKFAFLAVELQFLTGRDKLTTLIEQVIEGKMTGL